MTGDRDLWDSSRGDITGTVSGNSVATSDSNRINEDNAIDSSASSRPGVLARAISSDSIQTNEVNAANFLLPLGNEQMSGAPASHHPSHLTRMHESSVIDTSNSAGSGPISSMPSNNTGMTSWPMVSDSSMIQSTNSVATEPMPWIAGPEGAMPYSSGHQLGIMPSQPIGALSYGLDMPLQPVGSTSENASNALPYSGVSMHLQSPIEFAGENITNSSLLNQDAANEVLGFSELVFNNDRSHQENASLGLPREVTTANELVFDNDMMRQEGSSAQMTQNGLHMEVSLNFEDISIPGLLNEVTTTAQPISNNEMLRQNDPYAQVVQNDVSMGNLLDDGNESRFSLPNTFTANEFPDFPDFPDFPELPELAFDNGMSHQYGPNPNLPNEVTANEFAKVPELVLDNSILHQDGTRPSFPNEVTAIAEPVANNEAASITGLIANNEIAAATEPVAEDERPSQKDPVHKHESVHNDGSADNLAELRRSKADELTDRQERAIAALLIRFQNLVKLAALPTEDAFTKETAAAEGLRMEVESNALTSAAEDLLKLTRELKECWIFGSLRGIGEGEGDGEMETDSKKVAELIEKQLEKKHEQEKNKA
ncbi:hypothetical protein BGAL_0062g00050 [Botrytis galanthina]|uniref:Mediator of RNA polymerase II transcription subunit 22 n=1 Tax=Botrytis galanthina TaxID=278940 RepID=A0A4S8REQ6_9HELO|nr:hypothetical protein BGAL_0062g00050 [Botrytis galanthina]